MPNALFKQLGMFSADLKRQIGLIPAVATRISRFSIDFV